MAFLKHQSDNAYIGKITGLYLNQNILSKSLCTSIGYLLTDAIALLIA